MAYVMSMAPDRGGSVASLLGELVRDARVRKGLKQFELGYAMGKDQPYISKLEGGDDPRPEDETLFQLAGILEIPARCLISP